MCKIPTYILIIKYNLHTYKAMSQDYHKISIWRTKGMQKNISFIQWFLMYANKLQVSQFNIVQMILGNRKIIYGNDEYVVKSCGVFTTWRRIVEENKGVDDYRKNFNKRPNPSIWFISSFYKDLHGTVDRLTTCNSWWNKRILTIDLGKQGVLPKFSTNLTIHGRMRMEQLRHTTGHYSLG